MAAADGTRVGWPAHLVCANPDCNRKPWRRGLCSPCYRRASPIPRLVVVREPPQVRAPRHLEDEPPAMTWTRPRRLDQLALDAIDRVLLKVEDFNWYADPTETAPDDLVAAYRRLGGRRQGSRPNGGTLHEWLLDLEGRYLRELVIAPVL